ncbi:MAG: AAA family ATPase [Clostridiales bacterium]|nr:AAA family ATPase [Clostridiales bacterium]
MERMLIIGGNGCGKTTLAKELSVRLSLPLTHLDVLYWRDHWASVSPQEFDDLLKNELIKPQWIIDGNFRRTLPLRLAYCDTVIFMDFSRFRCVYGTIKRIIQNHGKSRPDMGGYCPEKWNREKLAFVKSVWNFNRNNRQYLYDTLNSTDNIHVIVIKNRRQIRRFLQNLQA